jgi:hypothetical protein
VHSFAVLVTQNSARNGKVIILTEKTEPMATKHTTESVVAFDTSAISPRLLDSLLDLYRPQAEKTKWQRRRAKAKMAKSVVFVLREGNRESGILPSAWTMRAVVSPNDSTTTTRSNNFRMAIGRRYLSSVTMPPQNAFG